VSFNKMARLFYFFWESSEVSEGLV